jgi:two-component system sensor histidine kinase ArlS
MTLRVRSALVFAGLSLLLLVGSLGYIYASHARSRQQEFYARLEAQCVRVASLLDEVRQADRDLLRIIDLNTIHRIHDEKVLLFNEHDALIYASLDDEPIHYNAALLRRIREQGRVAYTDADRDEVVGLHYTGNGADMVVLASAYDTYGQRELDNLARTLLISLGLGIVFIFFAAYFYIGFVLRPIARLQQAINALDVDRLDQPLTTHGGRDEIDRLAASYDAMRARLHTAFEMQRAFVRNASHELRTPLARINAQVEQLLAGPPHMAEAREGLRTMQHDVAALASLVESLLLLQRLQANIPAQRSHVRVDEVLYACLEELREQYPHARTTVDLDGAITHDGQLIVHANALLLRTAVRNLLINALQYAPDHAVHVHVGCRPGAVVWQFTNAGAEPLPAGRVFEPFYRGERASDVRGSGLGLSIVRQVVQGCGGRVDYAFGDGQHRFTVELPTAG